MVLSVYIRCLLYIDKRLRLLQHSSPLGSTLLVSSGNYSRSTRVYTTVRLLLTVSTRLLD